MADGDVLMNAFTDGGRWARIWNLVMIGLIVAVLLSTPYLLFRAAGPRQSARVHAPPLRTTCAMLGTWQKAEAAYRAGDWWLDGDGDSVPCESLPGRQ